MGNPALTTRRWKVVRNFVVERWRVIVYFRAFHGFGVPFFEFEFRFGFPAKPKQPECLIYEGDLDD